MKALLLPCLTIILAALLAYSQAVAQPIGQAQPGALTGTAQALLAAHHPSIHQVRIINTRSRSKVSSGSGFFVAPGNLLATNYHVVSDIVWQPQEYRAVVEIGGEDVELELLTVDVVNDLAVLRVPVSAPALTLAEAPPPRGARLYAVGNPYSIGMTVVEGNYNGLVDNHFFDRIHYSGALNPGMSGGPALDEQGQVVGINVATRGNQVGFLVPVDKLRALLAGAGGGVAASTEEVVARAGAEVTTQLQGAVADQLAQATDFMMEQILASEWPADQLAEATVVGKIHPALHCWGNSEQNEDEHMSQIERGCHSDHSFWITEDLDSGFIEYEFWYVAGEEWPPLAFSQMVQESLSYAQPGNTASEEDVENYTCMNEVVRRGEDGLRRKISYCARPYIKLPGLYDVFYMGATLDHSNQALMEHYTLSGVSRANADRFLQRFIRQTRWQ